MKGKLLVVDDEPVIRCLLRRFLEPIGYELIEAGDGSLIADMIRRERPAMVLLDIHMPRRDGIAAIEEIRSIDPDIAVIIITGDRDLERARLAMERGACDYITKPFDPQYLETSILVNLGLGRDQGEGLQPKCLTEGDAVTEAGLLSSAVVHDLNNTCSVVVALTDIALKERLSPRTRQDLADIRRAAARGKTILDNFAVLTRGARLPMAACDVNELLESAVKSLRDDLAGREIAFERSLARETPIVLGHRAFLLRTLLILMNNAVNGTKDGGAVALRTELTSQPGCRTPLVRVSIEDFGPGIPAEKVERMFKPFSVAGACRDTAGLELHLSSRIASQHKGRLSVENKPEGGACFTLLLPVIRLGES